MWLGRFLLFLSCLFQTTSVFAKTPYQFYHTPLQEFRSGEDLEFSANIPRKGSLQQIIVSIQFTPKGTFQTFAMSQVKGDYYELRIPKKKLSGPFLLYAILGTDLQGRSMPLFGSLKRPHRVKVLPSLQKAALAEEFSVFGAEVKIFSASRREQKITQAPSAITVLTNQDILRTGLTSLAQILRQVPGMDIISITRSDPNLSIRGFNREGANKLLTLLDGRSLYIDLFGITFWEALPVSLLEIDRIEVIRGPGSSLYGANAFGGVVNIYSIEPGQLKGFRYLTQAGPDGVYTTFAGGHQIEKNAFRLSTTYHKKSAYEHWEKEGLETIKGHGSWSHTFQPKKVLTWTGGFSRDQTERLQTLFGSARVHASQGFVKANLQFENWRLQVFWNTIHAGVALQFPMPDALALSPEEGAPKISLKDLGIQRLGPEWMSFHNQTVDVETQYTFHFWQDKDRLVLGGNFRTNYTQSEQLAMKENTQILGSLFVHNELTPVSWFQLSLGGRFDFQYTHVEQHPTLYRWSPQGAMIFKPHAEHTLRISSGLAFRYPAFLESGLHIELIPTRTLPNGSTVPSLIFQGEKELKPEQLFSVEFGYAGRLFQRLLLNIDLYYQMITDLILFEGDVSALFDYFVRYSGLSNKELRPVFTFNNDLSAWAAGAEVSLQFLITSWLTGFVNYSFQYIRLLELKNANMEKLCQPGEKCPPLVDEDSPAHKLNVGLHLHFRWFRMNLYGHFVSETRRINFLTCLPNAQISNPLNQNIYPLKQLSHAEVYQIIPSYFLLNLNLSVPLWGEKMELGFSAENILALLAGAWMPYNGDGFVRDGKQITGIVPGYHIEYPRLNLFGQISGGELIGGRIYAFVRGKI